MRIHRSIPSVVLVAAVMSLLSGDAHAAAISWDGGGNGSSWSDPNNWSANVAPGAGDDVIINVEGNAGVVYSSGTTTINSLTCDESFTLSGGALTITSGCTVNGTLTLSGGALTLTSGCTVNGTLTYSSGALSTGSVTGAGTVRFNGINAILDNVGIYSVANTTISAGRLGIDAANSIPNLTLSGVR